jgi:hypothetical protein
LRTPHRTPMRVRSQPATTPPVVPGEACRSSESSRRRPVRACSIALRDSDCRPLRAPLRTHRGLRPMARPDPRHQGALTLVPGTTKLWSDITSPAAALPTGRATDRGAPYPRRAGRATARVPSEARPQPHAAR